MSGFQVLPLLYISIEEEEGKREEDTGAVQGTQGPSAYLLSIINTSIMN